MDHSMTDSQRARNSASMSQQASVDPNSNTTFYDHEQRNLRVSKSEFPRNTGCTEEQPRHYLENSGSLLGEGTEEQLTKTTSTSQGRTRRGSLRKAAMAKVRERSLSMPRNRRPHKSSSPADVPLSTDISPCRDSSDQTALHPTTDGMNPKQQIARVHLGTSSKSLDSSSIPTDDEDCPALFERSVASSGSSSGVLSNFPVSSTRHRSDHHKHHVPTTTLPGPDEVDSDDEWDYSETERWGWVVLIATWLLFVVVMGSCFGVWSWAWDVGETPSAPLELEDDATLPITGYYPALMVCTSIMAWVWVVIAWVGMKYFRHAKVSTDG